MSLTSLAKLFGLFSLLVHLSVALPQASTCSCNGNISQKGSGECKTTHEGQPFCYVNQGLCQDEQESSQSGWFWSYRACGQGTRSTPQEPDLRSRGTRSTPQEPDLRSRASTCSCNGNISQKGSGECKTTHESQPFCYVNQGECPDQQESSQSGWFWSKQACASASSCSCNGNLNDRGGGECQGDDDGQPYCYVNQGQCPDQQESSQSGWFWSEQACVQGTKSTLQKPDLFSGASTCSCNGNISSKGSGECKTTHEEKSFCYVNQGQCPDELESSQSGWFWSKQACAPRTRSPLQGPNLRSGASTCSCNGNISQKGSGECKTKHEEKPFCYVNQGQCQDQQESSQSGWFWSKQACAPEIGTSLTRSGSGGPLKYLTSPNFPNAYPNNQDTTQTMSVPAGSSILVKFLDFQVENHRDCRWDYVQVCDANGNCEEKICGSSLPGEITIETSTATVKFHSDGSVTQKGFKLSYEALTGDCYEQNRDYPGNDINLSTGRNEDRRNSASECQDLCKQREGCKYFTWKSGSKECWSKTVGGPGRLEAGSISGPKTCGSLNYQTSPNFPNAYPNNQDTTQAMSVPAGSSILVKFLDFQIENHRDCRWDYVQVCDGNGNCQEKMCGSSLPGEITFETSTATVKFHSDGSVTQRGFKLSYEPAGGGSGGGCGIENTPRRIFGGSETAPNQYPWMVRLHGCGGALISDRHVVTARHCMGGGTDRWRGKKVKVSVHNQNDGNDYQEVAIKKVDWPLTGEHDFAIVTLDPVNLRDETIGTVCLPAHNEDYKGKKATALGWGATSDGSGQSSVLKHVELTVSQQERGPQWINTEVGYIQDAQQTICFGDSGGPLVYKDPESGRWTIIGSLNGFFHKDGLVQPKCSDALGVVWNKITAHLAWIEGIMDN